MFATPDLSAGPNRDCDSPVWPCVAIRHDVGFVVAVPRRAVVVAGADKPQRPVHMALGAAAPGCPVGCVGRFATTGCGTAHVRGVASAKMRAVTAGSSYDFS
ncbi:hypothetical protein A5640_17095 [Mycobacterium asiaticum]|uniref:Uncharacterized protein n=1 Tax=Mycobacterium asiaticum TaxID=1790 RepID=A0A1A3KHY4_MYCAS|nr:hypothetical protein A5640_17095 [Mycobacterium asiaticum]